MHKQQSLVKKNKFWLTMTISVFVLSCGNIKNSQLDDGSTLNILMPSVPLVKAKNLSCVAIKAGTSTTTDISAQYLTLNGVKFYWEPDDGATLYFTKWSLHLIGPQFDAGELTIDIQDSEIGASFGYYQGGPNGDMWPGAIAAGGALDTSNGCGFIRVGGIKATSKGTASGYLEIVGVAINSKGESRDFLARSAISVKIGAASDP